jgi:hypothetical protein
MKSAGSKMRTVMILPRLIAARRIEQWHALIETRSIDFDLPAQSDGRVATGLRSVDR